jgi:carboxypeptidase C (cathepsin A)
VFHGVSVRYTAVVGETILTDESGAPAASIFATSYLREDGPNKTKRPVIFAFNGGPGSASLYLHMGALGPKRVALPADVDAAVTPPYKTMDNQYSLLDAADLVLIDPVETGFSRIAAGAKSASFYTAAGDAKEFAQFIRAWLKANGREASPKYILGESYGTIRAVLLADELAKGKPAVGLDGIVLLGQAVNIVETVQRSGNIVGYAVNLPALAAIAWYHGCIDKTGKTLDRFLDDAYAFAMGEYLAALAKGQDLSEAERAQVAAKLARFTGISTSYYLSHDLVISKERFRVEILKDKGLVVGRSDGRYTGSAASAGRGGTDPAGKVMPAFEATVKEYLAKDLGVTSGDEYRPRDPRAEPGWNYGGAPSPFTDYDLAGTLARLVKPENGPRLMIGTGFYDTMTTTGATRYLVTRSGLAVERVTLRNYEGGHMFYTSEVSLQAFSDDLRAFVTRPEIRAVLQPVRESTAEVTRVAVRLEIRGGPWPALSLSTPITYASRTGIADRVDKLVLRDRDGVVPLRIENDPSNPGGFPFYRHWRAERPVTGPALLTYEMRPTPGAPIVGPQFDFYAYGGGISSGGMSLFVLPEGFPTSTLNVHWDLSGLVAGATAASTYGEGDFELAAPPSQLMQAYYMAGALGHYAAPGTSDFHVYWLGHTKFDAAKEAPWIQHSYEYQREFYRDTATSSYRVFIRALPGDKPILSGTALQNSFMVAVPQGPADPAATGPRSMLAHEMGHRFVGNLRGGGTGGATWFNEGLNVFYTRLLLLRSGLAPIDAYLEDINGGTRAYYASPYRNESAESLNRLGFSSGVSAGSAQKIPYLRGSMFFADVDAKIRQESGGRRKLDDVILPLFERRRAGEELDADGLVAALVKELGPSVFTEFESVVIRGETIVPEPGAFGPCFERRMVKLDVQGKEVEGHEWVRVASVPEQQCREW